MRTTRQNEQFHNRQYTPKSKHCALKPEPQQSNRLTHYRTKNNGLHLTSRNCRWPDDKRYDEGEMVY